MRGVFVGLGANLEDRGANLERARDELSSGGAKILLASAIRETEPFGFSDQPRFLNQVVEVEWPGTAAELHQLTSAIESRLGRQPSFRWGPRLIDLDLLLFGDRLIDDTCLTVPHPRLGERTFVLEPLLEIAPGLLHPRSRIPLAALLDQARSRV